MTDEFAGKVALITGGGSGIGRAISDALRGAGATTIVAGRRPFSEIEANGLEEEHYFRTDVSLESDVVKLTDAIARRYGKLDFAVNNAGIEGRGGLVVEESVDNWQAVFDVNVKGTLLSMKHEIPLMSKDGGAIVNVASIAGLIGFPSASVYVASKHAVIGLTKAAALEYSNQGIRINAIAPAGIQTEMLDRFLRHDETAKLGFTKLHPLGRIGTPPEVAGAALFLCSSGASFITGQTLTVDGGYTAQ
jgi:NAD(P)-dependent dehydrogenase (short-subunit alcohol dehydrogenase family)